MVMVHSQSCLEMTQCKLLMVHLQELLLQSACRTCMSCHQHRQLWHIRAWHQTCQNWHHQLQPNSKDCCSLKPQLLQRRGCL